MKVETIEIFGFASAIKALRLPFKGKTKSDSVFGNKQSNSVVVGPDLSFSSTSCLRIGDRDLKLLQSLIKNGDEHAKVLRGINVICSIVAPRYWWQEMDTYRVGTERLCSESTMHVEAKGLSGKELQKVKGELKESHEQERIQMFSYQTLRRIYFQRKNHRLPEWKHFCDWIELLPFAQELIILEAK
jgi:hypothetical protein